MKKLKLRNNPYRGRLEEIGSFRINFRRSVIFMKEKTQPSNFNLSVRNLEYYLMNLPNMMDLKS